jgi:hypothetical protein
LPPPEASENEMNDSSAARLNNRGFALANRSLALAPATGKPKGKNYRTDYD